MPTARRKKRLAGTGTHVGALSPNCPNALWALDFQFDAAIDGHQVKLLNVIDEFTRECLAIVVDHSIDVDSQRRVNSSVGYGRSVLWRGVGVFE